MAAFLTVWVTEVAACCTEFTTRVKALPPLPEEPLLETEELLDAADEA